MRQRLQNTTITITLEMIASFSSEWPYYSHNPRCSGLASSVAIGMMRKHYRPWCARIMFDGAVFKYDFLEGHIDYSNSNSVGSRGVSMTYYPTSGYAYAARRFLNPRRREDVFFVVEDDGEIKYITREEAYQWAGENRE